MPRQLFCVWAVQQSCVSPLEEKRDSQRVSNSSSINNIQLLVPLQATLSLIYSVIDAVQYAAACVVRYLFPDVTTTCSTLFKPQLEFTSAKHHSKYMYFLLG